MTTNDVSTILEFVHRMHWWHVYTLGVLVAGGRYLWSRANQTKVRLPGVGLIDARYLMTGILAILWPVNLLFALVCRLIGQERMTRIFSVWMERRGFYFESVPQPDGTTRSISMLLENTAPCAVCARRAPPMHVGGGCEEHAHNPDHVCAGPRVFLCPRHRTDDVIASLIEQGRVHVSGTTST